MNLVPVAAAYVFEISFIYPLFISLVTYIAIRLSIFIRVRQRRFKLLKFYGIPGPTPSILDGHYRLYGQNPANFLTDDYFRAKYGKTYGIFLGDEPEITSVDLELLRAVFLDKADAFKGRMKNLMELPISESIIVAPYHRWVVFRRMMLSVFSNYKIRGTKSVEFLEQSVGLLLKHIDDKFDTSQDKGKKIHLDVLDLMKATALHTISDMAIRLPDVRVQSNEEHVLALDKFLGESGEEAFRLITLYPFLKTPLEFLARHLSFDRVLTMINRSLNTTIDEKMDQLRSEQKRTRDEQEERLLDLLIRSHHEGKITRNEIISNCIAVLVAGYDTTSTTLTYLLWVLARHQSVQEMLRSELMTYGTEAPYLDQVINEAMRLYPALVKFTSRIATETVQFNGMTIPRGTKVIFNPWLIHRDPEIWPEPLKFDPGRFAPGVEHHPCAFAPFGLGARKCPGYHLAKLEMKMVVCDILLRYKITLISPDDLHLVTYAILLSKPRDKVILELERL